MVTRPAEATAFNSSKAASSDWQAESRHMPHFHLVVGYANVAEPEMPSISARIHYCSRTIPSEGSLHHHSCFRAVVQSFAEYLPQVVSF